MPDDASEEEMASVCVCVEKLEFIETLSEVEKKKKKQTQPNVYKANPQETEDRFDCFMQLFQHLMDLH